MNTTPATTAPVYDRWGVAVYQGDCLDVLSQFPDEHFAAVITDPPYELTDNRQQDCASDVLRNAIIRDAVHGQAHLPERNVTFRISGTLTERVVHDGIDLDDEVPSREEEVHHDRLVAQVDHVLMDDGDAVLDQQGEGSTLRLWVREGEPRCITSCRCLAEGGEGLLAIPVGLRYDPPGDTQGPADVVAWPRAEQAAVLTLDLRRGTAELRPARGADALDPRFLLLPAQTVGARAAARRLAAMLEAGEVCVVGDGADGTGPIYLDAHRDLLKSARPRITQSGFMNRTWDGTGIAFDPRVWKECLRVLRPGGYLLAFGGTRTSDLLGWAVRQAGFEIRDSIDSIGSRVSWVYGQGFAKSRDISKDIDRMSGRLVTSVVELKRQLRLRLDASGMKLSELDRVCGFKASGYLVMPDESKAPDPWGHVLPSLEKWLVIKRALGCVAEDELDSAFTAARRDVVGRGESGPAKIAFARGPRSTYDITAPATHAARQWQGWGTALKPAHEPVVVARKPFRGAVAANVLAYGTGALNVDACRVAGDGSHKRLGTVTRRTIVSGDTREGAASGMYGADSSFVPTNHEGGRWPPNVVLSHPPLVDSTTGEPVGDACADGCVEGCAVRELDQQSGTRPAGGSLNGTEPSRPFKDTYGEMNGRRMWQSYQDTGGASRFMPCFRYEAKAPTHERPRVAGEAHNTVKPLALMRWLARLVTPPDGLILDPFAGSGPTGQAARAEGFPAVLIEKDPTHIPFIVARLDGHPREDKPAPGRPAARDVQLDLFGGITEGTTDG